MIGVGLSQEAGQQPPELLLLDRHHAAGVDCAGCHGEAAPQAAPAAEPCLDCHGPYVTIVEATADVYPNPHMSHLGVLPCESCHHVHRPSEDACIQCHSWGYRVP